MINDFINKYFLIPIQTDGGYNFVNTITYAVIALILLYGIYKLFVKLKINIDLKFFYSLIPFIVLGSSIRAFVDHHLLPYNFWFSSPGIYVLVAVVWLGIFLLSHFIEKYYKNAKAWKRVLVAGALVDVLIWFYAIANGLKFANIKYGLVIVGLAILFSTIIYFIFKRLKQDNIMFLPFPAHLLDASATFIAVDFLGFTEKHPLPVFFSHLVGTAAAMYVLKLAVLIPAVYLIKKEIKDKNMANFLLIAIAVLGFAEGIRDLLTVLIA